MDSHQLQDHIDIAPRDWLSDDRKASFIEQYSHVIPFLLASKTWKNFAVSWIRWEIAISQLSNTELTASLEPEHKVLISSGFPLNEPFEALESKLKDLVDGLVYDWCYKQWNHRINSLFLAQKSSLDKASCWLLRNSDKDLITELYYRIKAGEATFSDLISFGEGPESKHGGFFSTQPLSKYPYGLGTLLEKLPVGLVTTPLKMGNTFCLVQLKEYSPATLDDDTSRMLFNLNFNTWSREVIDHLEGACVAGQV